MHTERVGDILDEMDRERGVDLQPQRAKPFVPETLPDVPPLPAPGIYFGMPFEQYRALPALGSHGVQDIMASPMIYWAKHSWLSEVARKQEARPVSPQTAMTRLLGEAYHCRILEGPEAYAERYCRAYEPDPQALESTDQIKAAIATFPIMAGDPPTVVGYNKPWAKVESHLPDNQAYQRAAKKEDWISQLQRLDKDGKYKIAAVLERQFQEANEGKQFVPADAYEQIELAARMISLDETAKHAVTGGYPEVTLIWHCAETGVPMKARVDYLKLRAMVDLKSYANEHRSAEEAIRRAIAAYKYQFQPGVYFEGAQEVKALIRDDPDATIHFPGYEIRLNAEYEWASKWATQETEPDWFWLFQQKGVAPITRLVHYDGALSTRIITDETIRQAKMRFKECSEKYGCDPWLDLAPAYDLTDDDVPDWAVRI